MKNTKPDYVSRHDIDPSKIEHVFSKCTGVTSITIPQGVNCIDSGAFNGCTDATTAQHADNASQQESNNTDEGSSFNLNGKV